MKNTIKAYTDYSESRDKHLYNNFDIVDKLPELKNIKTLIADTNLTSWLDNNAAFGINKIELDCEQADDDVYNYDFYEVNTVDIADYHNDDDEDKDVDNYIYTKYIAIEKSEDTL